MAIIENTTPTLLPSVSKAAVIGAGAAGLPTAKRLRDYGIKVVVYKRNSVAGDTWYIPDITIDMWFRREVNFE